MLHAFLPDWADADVRDLVVLATACVAFGVLWRYIVRPLTRGLRRGWRAMLIVGERFDEIPNHGDDIDELKEIATELVEQVAAIRYDQAKTRAELLISRRQNDLDHDYTRAALGAVAEWSQQFLDMDPIQLPDPPERVTVPNE